MYANSLWSDLKLHAQNTHWQYDEKNDTRLGERRGIEAKLFVSALIYWFKFPRVYVKTTSQLRGPGDPMIVLSGHRALCFLAACESKKFACPQFQWSICALGSPHNSDHHKLDITVTAIGWKCRIGSHEFRKTSSAKPCMDTSVWIVVFSLEVK